MWVVVAPLADWRCVHSRVVRVCVQVGSNMWLALCVAAQLVLCTPHIHTTVLFLSKTD